MEFLFEVLFQFLGEFLLQLLFEALTEIGLNWIAGSKDNECQPVISAPIFLLLGTLAGGISLLILPHSMITTPSLRVINVIGTPVLVSLCMMVVGNWRAIGGQQSAKLHRFTDAFCFAFAMALVRFAYAR